MVVNDVQVNRQAQSVRAIDEAAQIVRRAIAARRSERRDAVVAPVPPARKIGDRHQFDGRDSQFAQIGQARGGGGEAAFRSEGADVQFVEDRVFERESFPFAIGPGKMPPIDNLRRAMDSFRLRARCRIRKRAAPIQPITIQVSRRHTGNLALKKAVAYPIQGLGFQLAAGGFENHVDALGLRRPNAKLRGGAAHDGAESRFPYTHCAVSAESGRSTIAASGGKVRFSE